MCFQPQGPSTESARPFQQVHRGRPPIQAGQGLAPLWGHVQDIPGPEDLPLSKVLLGGGERAVRMVPAPRPILCLCLGPSPLVLGVASAPHLSLHLELRMTNSAQE